MKKVLSLMLSVVLAVLVVGCGTGNDVKEIVVDYPSVSDFENALNNGDDLTGKTVTFTADKLVPDGAMGYTIWAGEHLNFVSVDNPGIKEGDAVTVKVTEVAAALGSFIITYEIVK